MKVLHITNWFPNENSPYEALWIRRHIQSIKDHVEEQYILHLQVKPSNRFFLNKREIDYGYQCIAEVPLRTWFIIELITTGFLVYYLWKVKSRKFDLINFHIAYPLLTYWHWLKVWFKKPVIITEHWSAYHFNFGVKKKLPRIQRIFKQNIPVISVSNALASDIRQFANADFPSFVIPNVVDESLFFSNRNGERDRFFFMVSQWNYPKDPFPVLSAFLRFNKENNENYSLKIAGYGNLWKDMEEWVRINDDTSTIELLGSFTSQQIAEHLMKCIAFLHPSNYETFSVVCAEAVTCGALIIAPNIGGLPEVINGNGILLDTWHENDWYSALITVSLNSAELDRSRDLNRFSFKKVGENYFNVLSKIVSEV